MLQSFKLALRSIWGNKMRSFLTMLGIIIGITSVIDVTKKYHGISKFEYDGRRFKVSLLLGSGSDK